MYFKISNKIKGKQESILYTTEKGRKTLILGTLCVCVKIQSLDPRGK